MEYLPSFIRWIYRKVFMSCWAIEHWVSVAKKQAG